MATPASPDARLYFRCALQRYDDAQVLLQARHTTGAVYLGGYGIECVLKALILSQSAPGSRGRIMDSFRGSLAHDFEWLRSIYLRIGGARFPREVGQDFTLVEAWSTDLRYLPRTIELPDAAVFLSATERILTWANGRL